MATDQNGTDWQAEAQRWQARAGQLAIDQGVAQDDLAAILRELGLGDHARPESPHEAVQTLVLPTIRAWRMALVAAGVPLDGPELAARAAAFRWEYGVEGRWLGGRVNLDWRDSQEDAEGVLAERAEVEGNVVVSRLVRRLLVTGPVEEVPGA